MEVHLIFAYKMEPLYQCYGWQLICQRRPEIREAPHPAQLCYGQRSYRVMGEQVSIHAV